MHQTISCVDAHTGKKSQTDGAKFGFSHREIQPSAEHQDLERRLLWGRGRGGESNQQPDCVHVLLGPARTESGSKRRKQQRREGEKKTRLPFPSVRQSLPPVESRAGGWFIVERPNTQKKKMICWRVHFLLSPLTPGNKRCKAAHANHRISPLHLHIGHGGQTCRNSEVCVDKTSTSTASERLNGGNLLRCENALECKKWCDGERDCRERQICIWKLGLAWIKFYLNCCTGFY